MTKAVLAAVNGLRSLRDEFRQNDSGEDILATYDRIEARGGRLTQAQQEHRDQIRRSAARTRQRSQELQGDGALQLPEGYERVTTVGRVAGEDLPGEIESAQNRTRDAQLALIEMRKQEERAYQGAQRRANAEKFEAAEKDTDGKGGRGRRGPSRAAMSRADELFGADFDRIGGRFGATDEALKQARREAASAFDKGGNEAVARSAGLRRIGRLTGTKNIEKQISQDPLSQLLGVEALPDVSPAEIAQDRAPQVLTATINNDYSITMDFRINGADRPDLIPDQITDAFRAMFRDEVDRQSRYSKGPFSR